MRPEADAMGHDAGADPGCASASEAPQDCEAGASRTAPGGITRADRRRFLKLAAASGVGLVVGACGWEAKGPVWSLLRWWEKPSQALQRVLTDPHRFAKELPQGRTGAAFPQYFISPHVPTVDVPSWRLKVGGMVSRPLSLSLEDLMRLPRTTIRVRHYCVEGWTAMAEWTGVRVSELAEIARADPAAGFVEFRSFDSGYWSSWDRESAFHPQSIVAYGMDGGPLMPGHGAPARLYSNRKYGYKSVKYLTEVSFLPENTGGYYEMLGYEWWAGL
jgi:DMSO/TMAO reductase YedYZ molybdopterin-dependent catalytic subunit